MSEGCRDGCVLTTDHISVDNRSPGGLDGKLLATRPRDNPTPTYEKKDGRNGFHPPQYLENHQAHSQLVAKVPDSPPDSPTGSGNAVKRHSHGPAHEESALSTGLEGFHLSGTNLHAQKTLCPERQNSHDTVEVDRDGFVVVRGSHDSIFSRNRGHSESTMSPTGSLMSSRCHPKDYEKVPPSSIQPNILLAQPQQQKRRLPLRLLRDWEKVKPLRVDIWSLRSRLDDLRRLAHEKQAAMSNADNKFFRYVTRVREEELSQQTTTTPEGITLDGLFQACEAARTDYGPVEEELTSLESQIGIQEFALQKLETKLYEQDIEFGSVEEDDIYLHTSEPSSGNVSQISYNLHPLVNEHLSKLGDVDILRERLDGHFEEKENLEEEKSKRKRVGLELAEPDQKWLNDFEKVKAEIEAQLEVELKAAEGLRQKAFSMGLIDEYGEPISFEEREQLTFQAELKDGITQSGYVQFSALLPPPSGLQIPFRDSSPTIHPLLHKESIDPRLRVDQWLLHQLRMSSLEVNLLAETFTTRYGTFIEPGQWQQDVLKQWYQDKAGAWKSAPHTVSTEAPEDTEIPIDSQIPHPTSSPETIKDKPSLLLAPDLAGIGSSTDKTIVNRKLSGYSSSLPAGIY